MEIYQSNLTENANSGLISLCAEALEVGAESLVGKSLEELKNLDRKKCHLRLTELRQEINDIIENASYEGVRVIELGT